MRPDFLATQPQFIDHLAPVWNALHVRGAFFTLADLVAYAASRGVQAMAGLPGESCAPVVVCSLGDLRPVVNLQRPIVLMEHGVGLSFGENPGYNGGRSYRRLAALTLAPNWVAASHVAAALPTMQVEVVGTPKLDGVTWLDRKMPKRPVIALGFHWDGGSIAPEAGTAWPYYKGLLGELARRYKILGHGHPRIMKNLAPAYRAAGIEVVERWEDVMERADIYVNDCSSTMYEFLLTGKPVVILNSPSFRRGVRLGIRFWEYSDVGPQVNSPEDLVPALETLISNPESNLQARRRAVADLYPYRGTAAVRAARAISQLGCTAEPVEKIPAKCGIVYMAKGWRAQRLAEKSMQSLREIHPELPARGIERLIDSPFEYTLLLAPESLVVGQLGAGFQALRAGWEMVLAVDPRETVRAAKINVREIGNREHLVYSPGLIYYRKTAAVKALFESWDGGQASLLECLQRTAVKFWTLASCWMNERADVTRHVWYQPEVE